MALGGGDVLRLIIDADSSGATREFDKLGRSIKTSLGDVEKQASGLKGKLGSAFDGLASKSSTVTGVLDKIGISGQQAGAAIATALPLAAATAGAAIGAFALKGASDFANLGLAVDKFAQSSGLSLDQASRWVEVAGDLGISTDTVSTAFVKMEKAISTNRTAFGNLVKVGKDGGVDLTATFLAVSEHLKGIKDPIDRAAESSKLFGKGFSQVAQLLGLDADDLKKRLGGVADVKVFTPEKMAQVKAYRDSMANLHDKVEEVQLSLGQHLVPQLAKLAGFAAKTIEITVDIKNKTGGDKSPLFQDLPSVIGTFFKGITTGKPPWELWGPSANKTEKEVVQAFDAIQASANGMGAAIGPAGTSIGDFVRQADQAASINTIYGGSADAAAENLLREKGGSDEAASAAKSHAQALDDVLASQLALVDSSFAQHKLTLDVVDAQKDLTKAQQDGTSSALELQVQQDNVVASAIALASKNKEVETSAHGADAGNQAFSDTLQYIANSSSPEVKAQLQGVIDKLKTTGEQHPNPTVDATDNATAKITPVQTALTDIQKHYTATVDVNTSAADTALTNLRNRLNSAAGQGVLIQGRSGVHLTFARGGLVPGSSNQAVPAIVHGGEYVLPSGLVDAIRKGRAPGPSSLPRSVATGGGQSVVVNISGAVDPYNTARQIQTILARGGYAGFSAKAA